MAMRAFYRRIARVVVLFAVFYAAHPAQAEEKPANAGEKITIADGKKVSLEYTLTVDGKELESNKGKDPLTYNHGQQEIVPGLESQLNGMSVGESKTVVIKPDQGYGELTEEALVEVDLEKIPEEARKVGARVATKGEDGSTLRAQVKELKEKEKIVILDFNHPLAGKTLTFDVKVLGIE